MSPSSDVSRARTDQYVDVERHPENESVPGVVVLRVESGLFFANADAVAEQIRAHATGRDEGDRARCRDRPVGST